MLFLMILLHILIKATFTKGNAGTAIFYNRNAKTDCWNNDDIVKLRARKAFEELIPHVNPDEIDVKYIKNVLRYFRKALHSVEAGVIKSDPHTIILLQDAIADTIGAHLRSEMLPAVRFAYYAGYVPYRHARQLHDLFDDLKVFLNTQGLGWKKPKRTSQKWSNLTVAKILIGAGTFFDPCSFLITKRDSNSCIHFPIPKHDDDVDPAAVALPFKSDGLVSLVAPRSSNILLKYYTTASRCILSSSPKKCRHSDFVSFNNELWHWMKRDVAPHLIDEKLYAAYGGILRIAAAVQNYGKGLSRRNLFEYQDSGLSKWNPWKSLAQSYVYVNADWTPTIYVGLVLLTAFSIYLVQICYSYICGDKNACNCKDRSSIFFGKDVGNSNIKTKISEFLPNQQAPVYYNDKKSTKQFNSESKFDSLGSIRTQKVYDLNENTEKMMSVIMSDNESIVAESSQSQTQSSTGGGDDNADKDRSNSRLRSNSHLRSNSRLRSNSPPKLETSMSQLKLNKKARVGSQLPMYSINTKTRTQTASNPEQIASDSVWTASETSSSSRTGSSTSSKSHRSRSSRDLAWARQVISKHTSRSVTKSTSRTELDVNSFTTPTSQT